ncbi:hypothetical protein [Thermogemmatispora carboxidivorans]|nr:hypothetical protein [Thermogemmatispora carboxidivorans]
MTTEGKVAILLLSPDLPPAPSLPLPPLLLVSLPHGKSSPFQGEQRKL